MPETWVPWPWSSSAESDSLAELAQQPEQKQCWSTILFWKAGWSVSIPVSITQTVSPAPVMLYPPIEKFQTSCTLIWGILVAKLIFRARSYTIFATEGSFFNFANPSSVISPLNPLKVLYWYYHLKHQMIIYSR